MNKKRCKSYFVLFQTVASLGTNRIVSVDGPFKGSAADVTIARESIIPQMLPDERLLADAGYRHENCNHMIVAPGGQSASMTSTEREFAGQVHSARQVVERLYSRMQEFNVIKGVWRFDLDFLGDVFMAVAQITNYKLKYLPLNRK